MTNTSQSQEHTPEQLPGSDSVTKRSLTLSNRVTEKAWSGDRLWLVSAEWRGGHDKRPFKLENIYRDEASAKAAYDYLTTENHNANLGRSADYDSKFVRHPIRVFQETNPDTTLRAENEALVEALEQASKNAEPKRGEVSLHATDWFKLMDLLAAHRERQ